MTYRTITEMSELTELPDGTLLRWLAVPGDPTSEAVAFFRRTDREQYSGIREDEAAGIRDSVTTSELWISPGNGWEPESLSALRFPIDIITPSNVEWPEAPQLPLLEAPQMGTLISGGTYPRDVALQAAAVMLAPAIAEGQGDVTIAHVIDAADQFIEWLARDYSADVEDDAQPGYFAGGMA